MTRPVISTERTDSLIRSCLGFLMTVYSVGVLALYLGLGISRTTGLIGIFLGTVVALFISPREIRWKSLAVLAFVLLVGSLTSYWFFDYSSDGVSYHKSAIIQFLSGWNPYLDKSSTEGVSFWTTVYPKASWILGAQIVAVTGFLETGKVFNLLGILMAFLAAYRFLFPRLPQSPRVALFAAVLIGFNPVSTYQSLTFYLDGLLASVITVLLFSMAEMVSKPFQKKLWAEAIFSGILLANLKFTGLVYTGLIFFAFTICLALQKNKKAVVIAGSFAALILVLSLCIYGKTPYLDNLCKNQNIFYPVIGGPPGYFSMDKFRPCNFDDKNRFQRWLVSSLSHSQSVYPPDQAIIRLPFDFSKVGRHWVDTNVGGFGPIFGEAFLILGGFLLVGWRFLPGPGWPSIFLVSAILLSSFSHQDAWWARYAPQMFLLPVLGACFLAKADRKWVEQASSIIIGLLMVNFAVVGLLSTATKAWGTILFSRGISEMRKASVTRPIEVDLEDYGALKRHLEEQGVRFVEKASDGSPGWQPLPVFKTCSWRQGDDLSK